MPEELDPETMDNISESGETWIIDFWAEWCGPCKQFSPVFEEVSDEFDDVKFGKVDMEEHQQLGTSMGVRALPTTLIIEGEEEIARKSGAMSRQELEEFVESNT
ncbi:MAG: thioredoxin family protein [Candidatus Nanohaloarchaea archaeon]